jgi:hypothetical protein
MDDENRLPDTLDGEPSHLVPQNHRTFMQNMMEGKWDVGLYPVTMEGVETSCICAIRPSQDKEGEYVDIAPLFVGIFPGMKLIDPFGNELTIQDTRSLQ